MDWIDIVAFIVCGVGTYLSIWYGNKREKRRICEFWGITEEQFDLEIEILKLTMEVKKSAKKMFKQFDKIIEMYDNEKGTKKKQDSLQVRRVCRKAIEGGRRFIRRHR